MVDMYFVNRVKIMLARRKVTIFNYKTDKLHGKIHNFAAI